MRLNRGRCRRRREGEPVTVRWVQWFARRWRGWCDGGRFGVSAGTAAGARSDGGVRQCLAGGAVARSHGLDPVGFAAMAIVSGLGGGLIRDTLLQRGTPVALTDYAYLTTALIGAGIAFAVRFEGRVWDRLFPFVDALALGCWAAAGAQKTLTVGLGWLPAVLLGTMTAVG